MQPRHATWKALSQTRPVSCFPPPRTLLLVWQCTSTYWEQRCLAISVPKCLSRPFSEALRKRVYCPDPSKAIECPEGFYCKEGWAEPRKCSTFSRCPAGSSSPGVLTNAIIGIIVLLGMYICYVIVFAAVRVRTCQVNEQRDKREALASAVAPLLGPKYDKKAEHIKLFRNIQPRLSIRFNNLGLRLKDRSTILSGVTGEFRHSSLFAVMGPSGAGKVLFHIEILGGNSHLALFKNSLGALKWAVKFISLLSLLCWEAFCQLSPLDCPHPASQPSSTH